MVLRGPPVPDCPAQKWFYFATLKQAEKAKAEMEAGLRSAEATTFEEAVEQYQENLRSNGRRESTIAEAGHRLRPLVTIVGADVPVERLVKRHVEQRLASLPAVASRRGTLARIQGFVQWAKSKGLLRHDPTAGIVVEGVCKQGKPTLTRMEARRFSNLLWELASQVGDQQERALAILLLLIAGLREGELLRLQVRDLDLVQDASVVSVERWGKTRRALRDLEIPERLAAMLRTRVEGRPLDAWVWPSEDAVSGHREKTWLRKAVTALCEAAGVQAICPQGVRATHARVAREAGATATFIAAALGHGDVRVTQRNYIGQAAEDAQRSRAALKVLQGGRADE